MELFCTDISCIKPFVLNSLRLYNNTIIWSGIKAVCWFKNLYWLLIVTTVFYIDILKLRLKKNSCY